MWAAPIVRRANSGDPLHRTLWLSVRLYCATVNGKFRRRALFAEELGEILYKAENDDDGRACQSDEKHNCEDVHAEVRHCVHAAILPALPRLANIIEIVCRC